MRYAERQGRGMLKALWGSIQLSLIGVVFMSVVKFPWLRKKLPMPGEGPSEEFMNNAFFKTQCWALPHEPEGAEASTSNGIEPVRVHAMIAVCTSSHPISPMSQLRISEISCMHEISLQMVGGANTYLETFPV